MEERIICLLYSNYCPVDDLAVCNPMVGKDEKQTYPTKARFNVSRDSLGKKQRNETRKYFPFKRGHLAIAILRVGSEGVHMTVDGKHITSFAFREVLFHSQKTNLSQIRD